MQNNPDAQLSKHSELSIRSDKIKGFLLSANVNENLLRFAVLVDSHYLHYLYTWPSAPGAFQHIMLFRSSVSRKTQKIKDETCPL